MNRRLIYLIPLLAAFLVTSADAWEPTVGDLFHVTGCENGTLLVPVVNMWNKPGGLAAGAKVIGKLSGDGRKDLGLQCQGSIVKVLKVKRVSGRTFLKIKSVVNSKIGWIMSGVACVTLSPQSISQLTCYYAIDCLSGMW